MAESVARVHTHTHTCNLINKKERGINYALFKIYITDRLLI